MTVFFFGSPKKTTVKIKQIRFFKIRKNINKHAILNCVESFRHFIFDPGHKTRVFGALDLGTLAL